MEHKAFVFDYDAFMQELSSILEKALITQDPASVIQFIEDHREDLVDPYEAKRLDDNWQSLLEYKDVHQYGDFALTKFYNPQEDIGLGYDWQNVQDVLKNYGLSGIVLGRPFGPANNLFDPGKMGSYFQSTEDVHQDLLGLTNVRSGQFINQMAAVVEMLAQAQEQSKGLYITF